ncbi:hypothetical protein VNI00_006660 [Paramarasmius palmivorus]|uniref:MFS general substrate transporter n=1 Tax=Paramarasmius palmivorus TaxID=297713 RepID=A0AAW0D9I0_9AGAR
MADTLELARQIPLPLSTPNFEIEEEGDTVHLNESSLPPVDGGFQAWSFLFASFLTKASVQGFPLSFGVFLEAYLKDPEYTNQPNASSLLPLIGPLASGIIYCSGPFINMYITRFPFHRRPAMWIGRAALMYYPSIAYMSEWFVRRRGLANGAISAGTAAGGLIFPLFLPTLISSQGISKALRYMSIGLVVSIAPMLPLVRGRLPEIRSPRARAPARMMLGEKAWLTNMTFWVVLIANTLQGFGYFVPVLWLPTFASALEIDATRASIALAMLNGGSAVGRVYLGYLCDKFDPWALSLATLIFTSLSTFILWGVLSYSFAGLVAFGVVYGLLAGGYTSLWTGFFSDVGIQNDNPTHSTIILGYLMFSRGIGNILSTPISTALSSSRNSSSTTPKADVHLGFGVDNGKYEKVIVYVGTCFAGAAVISLMGWAGEKRRANRHRQ